MKQTVKIRCKNNGETKEIAIGSTLKEAYEAFGLSMEFGPINATVNNRTEGLNYRLYHNKDVEYFDLHSATGERCYMRTLFFVLCKSVHDLYPDSKVVIDIPVSNGYYCNLMLGHDVTETDVTRIRERMRQLIDAKLPIRRYEVPTEEAVRIFSSRGDKAKGKLLRSTGKLYTTYYEIDDYVDNFYGSLLINTSQLTLFGLEKYFDGALLRLPSRQNPAELGALIRQDKMFDIFKEQHRWNRILGVSTVGDFNEAVRSGQTTGLINVSEALQEKKIASIAEQIAHRQGTHVVLIAGPSSSGKTTFCKRLSIQLVTCGIKPIQISLDDYFVDRHLTPKDENGEYDYESVHALNIPLLNEQLQQLFEGKTIELPKYNFQTGKSEKSGKRLQLGDNQVLVLEGIHALNPELTAQIPQEQKFHIYISALTTILLDDHNYIRTTDNRLLRRIIRDYKYRGVNAQETIHRWPSVRAGENKWIFPYQENADVMFNTAMLFELAVIKQQAEPLLDLVPENCPEYAEAYRLRTFLDYIQPIPNRALPPTSLLREFLGGSSFKY
ncbi:MAG TPA: AAA family ATPase [Prevotella sp.]|nr:AAA family ATPase [Prevotella sp.]